MSVTGCVIHISQALKQAISESADQVVTRYTLLFLNYCFYIQFALTMYVMYLVLSIV